MGRKRWKLLLAACCAAAVAAWLAPSPWPVGAVAVEASYAGTGTVQARVVSDAPVRIRVQVRTDERPIRPALNDLAVHVVLADGARELVPVVRWDEAQQEYIAQRRPPVRPALALALLAGVVVLWITEVIPLWVTSLFVPVVLTAAGAQDAETALAPFFHPIIALFFGGFLMAEAMHRVRLDRRVALLIVTRAGRSPVALFAAFLGVSAFLSMWMSNTAAAAVLIPIALAVTEPLGNLGYRKAVVLGIAYAATLGGVGSATGTPANPIAIEFLESFGERTISFADWFSFGLPMVVLFLPVLGVFLWRRSKIEMDGATFAAARETARSELHALGAMTRAEWTVVVVFLGVMTLWLTPGWHGLNIGVVALAGALVLAVLGCVNESDLGRISWASLLTFGGGLALGGYLVASGMSDYLATRFVALSGWPPLLGIAATALLTLSLSAVASNTASAAMMVPLAIPLAGILGIDPTLLVVVVAIASSIDFALVIGTPPTMVAYSTKLFSAREIFRAGILLDLIGVVLLVTVVVEVWRMLGLVAAS